LSLFDCFDIISFALEAFFMQSSIHPTYFSDAKVVCSCGSTFDTGSTKNEIRVEICSSCHPVYTGVKRFVDTLGRVDKFIMAQNNAAKAAAAATTKNKTKKDDKASKEQAPRTIKEMLEMMDTPSTDTKSA
jgi:large subunit ribosomal protein L31